MTGTIINNSLTLVAFTEACLDLSWQWLNDPEIRDLTMTPEFTRAEQKSFFESLPMRRDYLIWGIALDGSKIIGAAGLKNHRGALAEYWGYIGEKELWGRGFGEDLIAQMEGLAKKLGFSSLDLKVSVGNARAIALYTKVGYEKDLEGSTCDFFRMVKKRI